jgi:hypothetical protein
MLDGTFVRFIKRRKRKIEQTAFRKQMLKAEMLSLDHFDPFLRVKPIHFFMPKGKTGQMTYSGKK